MKKIGIIFLSAIALAFVGCDKTAKEDPNPYEGTTWTRSAHSSFSGEDYMFVLEFAKDEFTYYEADINGNYKSGMTQGPYTYNGNEITINNVRNNTAGLIDEYFTGASVSGNMITLHYYWVSKDGVRYDNDLSPMAKKK